MLIDPIDLKTILNNIQAVIPSYLSLPNDPNTNIWSFYKFLVTHPLMYNETLIISLIVHLVSSTFPLQLYPIHAIPMVSTERGKTLKMELKHITALIVSQKHN